MIQREIIYTPGLWKIVDEILINDVRNKDRDPEMDTIQIDIDPIKNVIKFYYNGKGIPITYIPSMIFDPLLPDFNFYDGEETVTGGLNYYGAKLGNIFSTAFELETASKDLCLRFKQTWTDNMTLAETPVVEPYSGPNYTKNTFSPDLDKFRMDSLNKDTIALLSRRAFEVATSTPGVNVYLNDKPLPINNFKEYLDLCLKGKVDWTVLVGRLALELNLSVFLKLSMKDGT
ncbi:hypothetical protein DAPPUDRAFT_274376 [Daphnia pulex]|uniref:DNA topoisomerase (ATP-hydrolyzing) n=1 Tax=Daphnia pulex TaxID=6669 RepID=E9I455_DAPPU|nr:hypothetical protein DAPPUDRAFT_274376 [Daphnia pulex]|eukprot:EFX61225.1 hypothetical protein DAPPUDRAFT_274376 [Daphnia pulex]